MYESMCVYSCVRACVDMHVVRLRVYVCVYVCMCVYVCGCECVFVCVYVRVFGCVCADVVSVYGAREMNLEHEKWGRIAGHNGAALAEYKASVRALKRGTTSTRRPSSEPGILRRSPKVGAMAFAAKNSHVACAGADGTDGSAKGATAQPRPAAGAARGDSSAH